MKRGKIIVIPEAIMPWFFIPENKEFENEICNDNFKIKKAKGNFLVRIFKRILNR